MAWTLGPTFNITHESVQFMFAAGVQSVYALPAYVLQYSILQPAGEILEFNSAGQTQSLPVPIPRLAGLDELEIEQLSFDISSAQYEDEKTISAQNVSSSGLTVNYSAPAGAPVSLMRIEIQNLTIPVSDETRYVIKGNGSNGSDPHVVFKWDSDSNRVVADVNGSTSGADYVHFLIQPKNDGDFGPPMAAAPYFNMPGQGASMYGPALGGANLSVFHDSAKNIRAVLTFPMPLAAASFKLIIGKTAEDSGSAHGGLPNDVGGIAWSAQSVVATYDVRPAGISITANVINGPPDEPIVARFDIDPGNTPIKVDFAPVARSLLKTSYPSSTGSDLGLQLNFTCDSPGKIRVNLADAVARYLRYPLGETSLSTSLKGSQEHLDVVVNEHLKPSGMSFIIDGTYGPVRLVLAADNTPQTIRHGFRVADSTRIARRMSFTTAERNLPLARIAIFGRASETGELLLTLHQGDATRIGPPLTEPLSIPLQATLSPQWYRVQYPDTGFLPPHPEAVWVVAQASRGVFWWYAHMDEAGPSQRSEDDGAAWTMINAKPVLQLAVIEVDSVGNPSPLEPLSLTWVDGVLNGDLVGISGQGVQQAPQFRCYWVAQSVEHQPFLDRIPNLGGLLSLGFTCRRDVELSLSQVVLVYNPWEAGGS